MITSICDCNVVKAAREDSRLVAWTVCTALDMPEDESGAMQKVCADPDSMYSWNKSLIATVDGEKAGCLVSYPGKDYIRLREYTWPYLWTDATLDDIKKAPCETNPDEYYLDSMAIMPQFRGRSIGKKLMEAAMELGRNMGYKKFSLIADPRKTGLIKYYESMGFKDVGEILFFGHTYRKMLRIES